MEVPQKLAVGDIEVKSPGRLIKEAILSYMQCDIKSNVRVVSACLEQFAAQIGIYGDTLKTYLQSKQYFVGSNKFRVKLTNTLGKGYDEIVLTDEQQIKRYVESIVKNIKQYNEDSDIEVLEKLKSLCQERSFKMEYAKMYWAEAQYHYNRKRAGSAMQIMEFAIKAAAAAKGGAGGPDLLFQYYSQLGLMYFMEKEHERARKWYNEAEGLLTELQPQDTKALFLHYYRFGILNNNTGEHQTARAMFEKALAYTDDSYYVGNALMNIGLSYKRQKNYDDALLYYYKSLTTFDEADTKSKGIVYNNIAEAYKGQGKYQEALDYVDKAFGCLEDHDQKERLISLNTYTQINVLLGEAGKGLHKLLDMLSLVKDCKLYNNFILEALETVKNYGLQNKEEEVLRELLRIINYLVQNTDQNEYKKELKSLLSDIYEYFYNGGGMNYEEKAH